jgi:hypothetical protein
LSLGVIKDAVSHFPGKIQSLALFLQHIDYSQALLVMPEASVIQFIEDLFPYMTERRVSQIVSKSNSLSKVFVEVQCPSYGPGYL